MGSGGMPADRSRGPTCGPAASGWLVVHRGSAAAPPDAWWHATPLPVPGAGVPLPLSDAHFLSVAVRSASAAAPLPAAPDPALVLEQTRYSQTRRHARLGQRASSTLQ